MPAYNLVNFVQGLESWGLMDVLLPFLLFFVVLFAVFQKSKVLGTDKKNLNMALSLVISLLIVIPHVIYGTMATTDGRLSNGLPDVVEIMNNSLPQVAIIVVAVLMVLLLLGAIGGEGEQKIKVTSWVVVIAFLVIIWIFGGAAGWWNGAYWFLNWGINPDVIAIIVILLVFGLIIYFVTKDDSAPAKKA
jgi:hypothetical protein